MNKKNKRKVSNLSNNRKNRNKNKTSLLSPEIIHKNINNNNNINKPSP
jgi:hypothetical protein